MKDFYFKNTNGVITLHCKALDDAGFTKHCFTTKTGGVSTGYLAQTNLSFSRECESNVKENYARVMAASGIDAKSVVLTNQEHTDIVKVFDGDTTEQFIKSETAVDGFVTNKEGVCLAAFTADCVPVIIADPVKRAVACIHSGWRGTAKKITKNAVELMSKTYGCNPADMVAAIGPCISKCCYEVGQDVFDGFGAPEYFTKKPDGKYMLDLVFANEQVLKEAGIKNIYASNECTFCKSDLYYSHRATKGKRGNMAALIQI